MRDELRAVAPPAPRAPGGRRHVQRRGQGQVDHARGVVDHVAVAPAAAARAGPRARGPVRPTPSRPEPRRHRWPQP
eukprot:12901437-Heterocapsa_arctica.AAC.1